MTEIIPSGSTDNLLLYIEKQLKRFCLNLDKAVETGDIEAVHDLRVASRRLAEPLRLLAPWAGRRRTDRIRQCLRRTRRAFRKVRDLDVVQSSLCNTPPPAPLDTTDLAQLEGVLTRRRERALRKAVRKVGRVSPAETAGTAQCIVGDVRENASNPDESDPLIENAADKLFVHWSQRLAEKDPRSAKTNHLHETRLCVKRLRYAAELRRDLKGGEADPLIPSLAAMQELLGQWNDHLTAARHVSAIARKDRTLARQSSWSARLLHYAGNRAQEAEQLRLRIIEKWPSLEAALGAAGREPVPPVAEAQSPPRFREAATSQA
jgi:CHAD domain-containing protein